MRDISRDPVDHGRTTRAYADESVPDPEKTPELVVVATAVLAFVAGQAWLAMERRRVRNWFPGC